MSGFVGATANTNDAATTPAAISIDSTTAVTVKPATDQDQPTQEISIYNSGNQLLWLRKYAASVDNLKKGEPILPGQTKTFSLPNMVTAEWSGIFNSGGARNVYTQYS